MAGGGQTGAAAAPSNTGQQPAQIPQWLKGLQAGQQIAALGQQKPQAPQGMGFQPRPQMGMQGPQGMPQTSVPGAQGMAPPMASGPPGMATGGMGMAQPPGITNSGQQPGSMTPQMMQQLMMMRQRGLM
jgi:hypothetical protein